ncbi:Uncharacterised protein [Bordetella pertussis]|nr:Uncharacterised protein [Bordetella pertussis]CPL31980.1 Uncharacterised protein [Bordetella pertussis]
MRWRRLAVLPRCSVSASRDNASSLVSGTMILATNTISAISHDPISQSSTTPPRMVWALSPTTDDTLMTGRMFAGI